MEGGYAFTSVCLSVCLLDTQKVIDFDEIFQREFEGGSRAWHDPRNNGLDFSGDPNHNPDPGIFKKIHLLFQFLQMAKNKTCLHILDRGLNSLCCLVNSISINNCTADVSQ